MKEEVGASEDDDEDHLEAQIYKSPHLGGEVQVPDER